MFSVYSDWDQQFAELRQQMANLLEEFDGGWAANPSVFGGTRRWPRVNVADTGEQLVLSAEVPGLSNKDIQVSLEHDVLTIAGERKIAAPSGYSVHRQEREGFKFVRSFNLPSKVNAEKVNATVTNGILTIALPKTPEAQPKRIEVRAS
jgi:HSP20 family protein